MSHLSPNPDDPATIPGGPLLDCPATATYLGVSTRRAREMFSQRLVPLVRVGRRVYARRADLDAFVDLNTIPAR